MNASKKKLEQPRPGDLICHRAGASLRLARMIPKDYTEPVFCRDEDVDETIYDSASNKHLMYPSLDVAGFVHTKELGVVISVDQNIFKRMGYIYVNFGSIAGFIDWYNYQHA